MYESEDPNVSHPGHYRSASGLEAIDVIEAFTEGLDGIEAVCTANVIKYICRWKRKGGAQDVEKAIWYATRLKEHLEQGPMMEAADSSVVTLEMFEPPRVNLKPKYVSDTNKEQ